MVHIQKILHEDLSLLCTNLGQIPPDKCWDLDLPKKWRWCYVLVKPLNKNKIHNLLCLEHPDLLHRTTKQKILFLVTGYDFFFLQYWGLNSVLGRCSTAWAHLQALEIKS
jgi:hypothetical protein